MIISIRRSSSFSATLGYVTHDKDGVGVERVGEHETRNLASHLPYAHKEMQTTADAARAIQARSRHERGERSQASGDHPARPCLHIAMSWHHDDEPRTDHMFKTADRLIDALGIGEHQAVIVQHLDTPSHAHLHLVVSAIHPETGQVADRYRDYDKASQFAQQYEQERQMFRSFKRAAKNEPKPTLKLDAEQKAQQIREAFRKREAEIKRWREDREKARDAEREGVVKRYESIKKDVREKFRKQIDAMIEKPAHNLNMKPDKDFLRDDRDDWKKDARTLKPYLQQDPIKPEPGQKAPGREGGPQFTGASPRSERLSQLKELRAKELDMLTKQMHVDLSTMRQAHAVQIKQEERQRQAFRDMAKETWMEWRKEYGIPERGTERSAERDVQQEAAPEVRPAEVSPEPELDRPEAEPVRDISDYDIPEPPEPEHDMDFGMGD